MKGSEKCSLSGTVKVTLVTSNLEEECFLHLQTFLNRRDGKPVDDGIDGGEDSSQPSAREGPAGN